MDIHKRFIAVFGGSNYSKSSNEYYEAYQLGNLLAKSGFNLINGAGKGLMEATAKGVFEGGGSVLGAMINDKRFSKPNKFNTKLIKSTDMFSRIRKMYKIASGFITLKGGTGTLAEFAIIWNLLSLELDPKKPFILIGEHWSDFLKEYEKHFLTTDQELRTLVVVNDIESAISVLINSTTA